VVHKPKGKLKRSATSHGQWHCVDGMAPELYIIVKCFLPALSASVHLNFVFPTGNSSAD